MADMTSKYQRVFAVTADASGIDPLRDKLVPLITSIKNFTTHMIAQDERAAPDLISLREYNTDEFWWIIMCYNGISSYRSLVEGQTIKIPSLAEVVNIVTENSIRPNKVQRVITI